MLREKVSPGRAGIWSENSVSESSQAWIWTGARRAVAGASPGRAKASSSKLGSERRQRDSAGLSFADEFALHFWRNFKRKHHEIRIP